MEASRIERGVTLVVTLIENDVPPLLHVSVASHRAALGDTLKRWAFVVVSSVASADDAHHSTLVQGIGALDGIAGSVHRIDAAAAATATTMMEAALSLAALSQTTHAVFSDGDCQLSWRRNERGGGDALSAVDDGGATAAASWSARREDGDGARWWDTIGIRRHRSGASAEWCAWRWDASRSWDALTCRCQTRPARVKTWRLAATADVRSLDEPLWKSVV